MTKNNMVLIFPIHTLFNTKNFFLEFEDFVVWGGVGRKIQQEFMISRLFATYN